MTAAARVESTKRATWMPAPRTLALAGLAALVGLVKAETVSDPYVWDSLGGIIAPALDSLDHGFRLIHDGPRNFGHPPLFHLALALTWKVFGTSLLVSHLLGLACAVAALAFTGLIAARWFGPRAGVAAPLVALFHSLFFAQSGTVNDSMPLAALSMATLWAWLERRWTAWAVFACALVLTKETGALLVFLLSVAWGVMVLRARGVAGLRGDRDTRLLFAGALAAAVLLAAWYAYQYSAVGFALRTDLVASDTTHPLPLRVFETLKRYLLWDPGDAHTNGLNGVLVCCAAVALARLEGPARQVVAISLTVFVAHVVLFALTVDIPRYHAPYVPFLALAASGAVSGAGGVRRLALQAAGVAAFIFGSTFDYHSRRVKPGFLLESNLDYRDQLAAHRDACAWLEAHHDGGTVHTVWPMSDELSDPRFGYVTRALPVAWADGVSPGLYYVSDEAPLLKIGALPQPLERVFTVEHNRRRAHVFRAGARAPGPLDPARITVERAVIGLLNRAPTAQDYDQLAAALGRGHLELVRQIVDSREFRTSRASLSAEELSDSLYRGILGREPDVSGRASTSDAIRAGKLSARTADMLASDEFAKKFLGR